jgi:predicted CopG family antitoxin
MPGSVAINIRLEVYNRLLLRKNIKEQSWSNCLEGLLDSVEVCEQLHINHNAAKITK